MLRAMKTAHSPIACRNICNAFKNERLIINKDSPMQMIKYYFCLLLLLVATAVMAQNGLNPGALLPEDPKVAKGVLDNGLTYYVRSNDTPKKQSRPVPGGPCRFGR